ncbi:hypothetical protein [Thermomonospora catenispora]|uniref:hypothetical protein n=1 Tax=Thermomonospora catenispora TaxID=2493090 RepID=UPI00111D6F6C|nr:hypothetical protein [Thermomonospora catenispora]TNY35987.1 hypothetical protein EIO00_16050 [Thermomonospora catenispora]
MGAAIEPKSPPQVDTNADMPWKKYRSPHRPRQFDHHRYGRESGITGHKTTTLPIASHRKAATIFNKSDFVLERNSDRPPAHLATGRAPRPPRRRGAQFHPSFYDYVVI